MFLNNSVLPIEAELGEELSRDIDAIVDKLKKRGEKVTREEVIKMLWIAAQDFDVESFKRKH